MLDMAFGLTDTSRLGCQVVLKRELDGISATLPSATRNMFVDGGYQCSKLRLGSSHLHKAHAILSREEAVPLISLNSNTNLCVFTTNDRFANCIFLPEDKRPEMHESAEQH